MSLTAVTSIVHLTRGALAGKTFELVDTLRVGRHPFNEISLPDPGVSRYHCWILWRDGVASVEDLASANGTFVNGERVRARRSLRPGDVIRTGSTEFRVSEAV